MNIKNIKSNNNGFYYYKTDEFATIDIRYYFNYENTKENYIKAKILSNYLLKTNKLYKTQKEITDRSKELYGLSVNIGNKEFGSKTFIYFELKMANPRIIEEDYFNDALEFYKNIMLKPNFKDNKLDMEVFNQIKKEIIDKENNNIKNSSKYNERLYYKNIIPNSIINQRIITDIKELEDIINKIEDIDIINFYNDIINNYITSFAFGNLLDEEIKIIENTFDFKQIDFDYKYDVKDEILTNDIEITSKETTQSYIYFTYEIKDYKKENSYIYDALNTLLNNNNGPIYTVYRTKLGISYSQYEQILYNNGVFFIEADIDKKNKQKAINGLKEIFDILNDKEEVERLLKYTKERRRQLLISYSESVKEIINELEKYILKYDLSEKEKLKLINNLSVDDIMSQINNLEYKCMYFYKGDKDEK
ncbi:MAG: insulinase family protein [Bacilli bacterium]|nr:insulinase family protein [Bacilli bacterium]